jgi:ABC-2 type transport system ATP-binding protein
MNCIEARGLRKHYGATVALDGVDLSIPEGRIVGLIGLNGAGKTTALDAILGLTPYQGALRVLDLDPWTQRDLLTRDVCFIADVAVLPRWLRVSQAVDYVAGVHPRFDRGKAERFLARTVIKPHSHVGELSKGMVAQLHLALVMAIDARLLVLDEPTLGLDILYRKQFYESLLTDYFDATRTILVTTHQVEEIQNILTDVIFIDRGRIVFNRAMDDLESSCSEVEVAPQHLAAARALHPIHEREILGRRIFLFDGVNRRELAALGDVHTPSLADLFIATIGNQAYAAPAQPTQPASKSSSAPNPDQGVAQ